MEGKGRRIVNCACSRLPAVHFPGTSGDRTKEDEKDGRGGHTSSSACLRSSSSTRSTSANRSTSRRLAAFISASSWVLPTTLFSSLWFASLSLCIFATKLRTLSSFSALNRDIWCWCKLFSLFSSHPSSLIPPWAQPLVLSHISPLILCVLGWRRGG